MDRGTYKWQVDQKMLKSMKIADQGRFFSPPAFKVAGLTWQIKAYPNGESAEKAGFFNIFLKLMTMPKSWKYIMCSRRVHCEQTKASDLDHRQYGNGTSNGWKNNMMAFSEIASLNQLSFTFEIMITKIVLKENDTVFYQKPFIAKAQQVHWTIDGDLLSFVQRAQEGKCFSSVIHGATWLLRIERNSSSYDVALFICALPGDTDEFKVLCNTECILKGKDIDEKIIKSGTYGFEKEDSGSVLGNYLPLEDTLSFDAVKQCDSVVINLDIVPDPDGAATEHWSKLADPTNSDQKEKEIEMQVEVDPDPVTNNQHEKRFNLMEARLDSLVSAIDGITSRLDAMSSQMSKNQSAATSARDAITSKMAQNNRQSAVLRDQVNKSVQSKFDQIEQRVSSIDSKLKEVQQRTDGKLRRNSENNQSQSVEILAQMAKMREEIIALKEAQGNQGGDEEVKEETEEDKLRKWMENEVKLPRYFNVLKENGFEDMESVLDLTLIEMKEMGIDKMGHRKRIMKHIAKLQAMNDPMIPVKPSMPQQQVPAATYSFGAAPAQSAKVDVEGANVVDTGH